MSIRFRCTQISSFDPTTGEYKRCNQALKVPAKHAGKLVRCPKCASELRVPTESSGDAAAAVPPVASNQQSETSAAGLSELDSRRHIMDQEFDPDTSDIQSTGFRTGGDRCPSCGGIFNPDRVCTTCGFQDPKQQAIRRSQGQPAIRPAGFQLWLMGLTENPATLRSVAYGIVILISTFLGLMIVLGILMTSLIGVSLSVISGFALLLLLAICNRARMLARDPEAGLGVLSPCWNAVLYAARKQNWQKYDPRLAGRRIIDLRHTGTSNSDLASVNGLAGCQVLDLEGCDVNDTGLDCLYGHRHLQCLVLRRTAVTQEGAAMLQQSIPRLWIWL